MKKIVIKIWTGLDGYHWEKLEDALAKCIRKFGIEGEIENKATGNSVSILRKSREQRATETFARVYQEVTGKKAKMVGKNEVEVEGGLRCRAVV